MLYRVASVAVCLMTACRAAPSPIVGAPVPTPVAGPASAPSSAEASLDAILIGGKVFTADAAKPWAEAIAIRGERIAAVGTTAEIRALVGVTATTRVIELGGRVVIPGINDAHIHAPDIWQPTIVRVNSKKPNDPTLDEVAKALAGAVKVQPPGTWLSVRMGTEWYDDPKATRTLLDRVAPAHPVWTNDIGGHARLLNTAALKALGISLTEADPPHGKFGRDAKTKQLDGWLHESPNWRSARALEEALPDDVIAAAVPAFEARALRFGITSVQNMPAVSSERFARVLAASTPKLRWRLIRWPHGEILKAFERSPANARVRIDGVKYVLDGTPLERWAGLSKPYKDRSKTRGQISFSPDEIRQIIEVAYTTREPLLLHAVGDATIDAILAAMEKQAPAQQWRERRVRVEHGDLFTPTQIVRAAALGVIVVQNPAHLLLPEILSKRLGDCGGVCQPLKSLVQGGVAVALGSDGPLNPFLGMMAATIHPTSPREALTREEAVLAYTRGAAVAEFSESEKGTLAPGMQADLVVLTQDIFTIAADALPATEAWLTVIGGKIVYTAEAR